MKDVGVCYAPPVKNFWLRHCTLLSTGGNITAQSKDQI